MLWNICLVLNVAFGAVLGLLVQGLKLDIELSGKLMGMMKSGGLPFHALTRENMQPPRPGDPDPPRSGLFASHRIHYLHLLVWTETSSPCSVSILNQKNWQISDMPQPLCWKFSFSCHLHRIDLARLQIC
jgi:hypothetical protein